MGEEVRGELPGYLAKRIGVVLERTSLIDTLTAVENLELIAHLLGLTPGVPPNAISIMLASTARFIAGWIGDFVC